MAVEFLIRHIEAIKMGLQPVGYVYVVSNPKMPGIVKVGMTDRHNVQERVDELSCHTGVPAPFTLEYVAQVYFAYQVEQEVHRDLANSVTKSKEFFECSVQDAALAIRKIAGRRLLAEDGNVPETVEQVRGGRCDRCGNALTRSSTKVYCSTCGRSYPLR